MAEELTEELEEEIFEINDFTNATEWESFIASIEQVFHQWGLAGSDQHSSDNEKVAKQHRKVERVSYCGRTFVISLEVGGVSSSDHTPSNDGNKSWAPAMRELMNRATDFPPRAHHLSRWYGHSQFVLIAPGEGESSLSSQAQTKLMISSVSVAVSNTSCVSPVFVQVHQKWRQMYVGVCECEGVRTDYNIVHLKYTPPHFSHLSGLLELFKGKLKCQLTQTDPVHIAARYTYVLNHWSLDDWPVEPMGEGDEDILNYGSLSVGAISDPVQELHLSAVWPNLSEEMVADTEGQSVLIPIDAPVWTVVCQLSETTPCLLSEQLSAFLKLCYHNNSITGLLGRGANSDGSPKGDPGFSKALSRLTRVPAANMASPFLPSGVAGSSETTPTIQEALNNDELDTILKCLFPEAYKESEARPHTSTPSHKDTPTDPLRVKLKSSPRGSLTSRLADTLCVVNNEHGLRALAFVWFELVQEFRYRWENGIPLESLPEGQPDMNCCLLHQKLQMLNCCIRHKISHEHKLNTPNIHSKKSHSYAKVNTDINSSLDFQTPNTSGSIQQTASESHDIRGGSHDSDNDSDEFFEAVESHDNDVVMETDQQIDQTPTSSEPCEASESRDAGDEDNIERVGALRPCGDLVLVATGKKLFIPVTQEHTPMTEDMLTEQANVLSRLGTSEEAAKVRAKMQSSSLISDMQAFKAANPGCLLDDFVRWYSPRDWTEDKDTPPPPPEAHPQSDKDPPTTSPDTEGEQLSEDTSPDDEQNIATAETAENINSRDNNADSATMNTDSAENIVESGVENTDSAGDGWDEGDWAVIESDDEMEEIKKETVKQYVKGHLSARMLLPDNIWVETWNSTTPLPAYKQKRLFDDTREAEKLLHFLGGQTPCGVALLLMPVLLHSAILVIRERQDKQPLAAVDSLLQDVVSLLSTEPQPSLDSLPKYQECIGLLSQAEHLLATAQSLRAKFYQGLELSGQGACPAEGRGELEVSAELILNGPELVLSDPTSSLTGKALRGLLTAQSAVGELESISLTPEQAPPTITANAHLQPSGMEYILRATVPLPTPLSQPSPQRMYSVLTRNEFRLAGAFSRDIKLT